MSSTEHNFSGALATWRDINLSELQKSLDAQGIELVDNQKESVVGRKALADKTKEFKKIPDEGKLTAFKGLLKAYQTEIDNLTKRSKASENAFLNVYKVLAEAPDPYPLLEAAVDQTVKVAEARELETELRRLHDENADLKRRVNETASIETAKKKAEAKVEQLEQTMEDLINDRVSRKENELNATYDEKLRNYEEREQDLHRQISLTTAQLRDLRMSNDTNQAKLLDHSTRQDQEVVAKFAEVDMMVADLERANSRVATVERRNEILRAEIEVLRSGSDTSDRAKSLQAQVTEYEAELERTSQTLELQKAAASELEAHIKKTSDDFAKEMQKKASEIDTLRNRLKQYNDYDEIKRELDIMKYVEFAGFDEDIDEDGDQIDGYEVGLQLPNPNADKTNAQQGKSLEALLATKNKRLLEELTKFRILHSELENSLQAAQDQLSSTGADLEKQKALNEKLENDLLSMNKHRSNGDITPPESSDVLTGLDLGRKAVSVRTTPIPFTSSADTSILPIVTSQRDRFRQRNAELEEELRRQFQIISDLRSEVKNLQADNLKLYEKVRYMQSYREEAGSRPVTSQLDPLPTPANNSSDDLGKYRARYEEAMNPFEAFRGREATRAYQNLNAVERGVLTITRAMLSNRRARAFFILYSLGLHLLVMYTTYECTTTSGTHLQKQPGPYGS
ncbi:CASP C terminal-domain-containing protein [Desarmillaria tabescens]|uniref:Protein CASP n=1 Tax=Armillaria tabescens TaxID=1929756 RepID=A0AA39N903_ARMTA|nr:CASP C terminal-domain-containing protein [Desarmillaria tabescens]KAK0461260.1 CASP C terminal-domain-containing protein [Desarmillaria tabescens]